MTDTEKVDTPASKVLSDPQNLTTVMGSDALDETSPLGNATTQKRQGEEEEDEDMDALIDELESNDGHEDNEDSQGEEAILGAVRVIPEAFLQTDTRRGLSEVEVLARRKKFGLNKIKEGKENLVLKFLGYFIGPIQFVMEVRVLFYLFISQRSGSEVLFSSFLQGL